ncbi:MAG TPA: hypothetical protein VNO43_16375, partial [Candidatus Eisenbacteria bacterium]|nr:hypothetical protein [Candidatus Eisenbacteria bacterium]
MPWPQNGDYYVFKEESIKAKAPPVSGIYGLYSIKHYVLIEESEDIREALLRREKEKGFRLSLYRPIGFTFEVCPPERRRERAQQLVAEYRPVLQTRDFLSMIHWRKRSANDEIGEALATPSRNGRYPATHEKQAPKLYFSREQIAVLILAFVVTALGIGFLGFLAGKKIEARRGLVSEASLARIPVDRSPDAVASAAEPAPEPLVPSYFQALTESPEAVSRERKTEMELQRKAIPEQSLRKTPAKTADLSNEPKPADEARGEASVEPQAKTRAPKWSVQVNSSPQ